MVFLVLKKLIGRWNKVFETLKVLQETRGGLGQLKVFTLWTPRICWKSSEDKDYAFPVFCFFYLLSTKSFNVYWTKGEKKRKIICLVVKVDDCTIMGEPVYFSHVSKAPGLPELAQSNGKGSMVHCWNSIILYLWLLVFHMTNTDWIPKEFINSFLPGSPATM